MGGREDRDQATSFRILFLNTFPYYLLVSCLGRRHVLWIRSLSARGLQPFLSRKQTYDNRMGLPGPHTGQRMKRWGDCTAFFSTIVLSLVLHYGNGLGAGMVVGNPSHQYLLSIYNTHRIVLYTREIMWAKKDTFVLCESCVLVFPNSPMFVIGPYLSQLTTVTRAPLNSSIPLKNVCLPQIRTRHQSRC